MHRFYANVPFYMWDLSHFRIWYPLGVLDPISCQGRPGTAVLITHSSVAVILGSSFLREVNYYLEHGDSGFGAAKVGLAGLLDL